MSSFRKYLKKLQQLDTQETLLTPSKAVLLLSGSSHYVHASLTKEQTKFLDGFRQFGYCPIASNFPYNERFPYQETAFPNLMSASLSNIYYFPQTLLNRSFQQELMRHLQPLFSLEEVLIITQSSGLNMLTQVLESITTSQLKIVALGPVSQRQVPNVGQVKVIKGRKDQYSRLLDRTPADDWVTCGHHDYLTSPEVWEVLYGYIQKD